MPRVEIERRKQYQADTDTVRTTPVPLGATKWTLRMSRDDWSEKTGTEIRGREVIYGQVDISYDGGLTYLHGGGVGSPGGVVKNRNGEISAEVTASARMLEPRNANRVARVTFKSMSHLSTQIDLDFD